MQPPEPQLIIPPNTLIAALGIAASAILGLVGIIYNSMKTVQKDQQDQLSEGVENFSKNAVCIANLQKDIESVRKWVKSIEKALDELEIKAMQDHDAITTIKANHKKNHGDSI